MSYLQQADAAAELMDSYRAYAESIGCTTYPAGSLHDTIECNAAQAELLGAWWQLHTGRPTPPYREPLP